MGGEKLNRITANLAVFFAALLFFNSGSLAAQEADSSSGNGVSQEGVQIVAPGDVNQALSVQDAPSAPEPALTGAIPPQRSAETEILLGEALPDIAPQSSGSQIFLMIRMVLVLALVAAAVYGLVFFLRRSMRPQSEKNPHLKILTSAHLGSNRYVYVVNVGTKAFLVGAGEGGVSLISEITDQEAIDAMLLEESRRGAAATVARFADFRSMLSRLTGRFSGGGGNGGMPFSAESLRKQRDRLKRL
ncbi:MAG: flagellar biosynthetic protein FliO [Treponema sp.]|nr:flagellar biosynthetic protein FliO [Treponema sp.]